AVRVLAERELKEELRIIGRGRLGRHREPEARTTRADEARHGGQQRLTAAIPLCRLLLDYGLGLADSLFGRLQRGILGEADVDVGDVEILARKKLLMEVACEESSKGQQDRKRSQDLAAMIDRKTGGAAVPSPEAFLSHPACRWLRLRS